LEKRDHLKGSSPSCTLRRRLVSENANLSVVDDKERKGYSAELSNYLH
jgi:hypothetical protein